MIAQVAAALHCVASDGAGNVVSEPCDNAVNITLPPRLPVGRLKGRGTDAWRPPLTHQETLDGEVTQARTQARTSHPSAGSCSKSHSGQSGAVRHRRAGRWSVRSVCSVLATELAEYQSVPTRSCCCDKRFRVIFVTLPTGERVPIGGKARRHQQQDRRDGGFAAATAELAHREESIMRPWYKRLGAVAARHRVTLGHRGHRGLLDRRVTLGHRGWQGHRDRKGRRGQPACSTGRS
jgi:hypothetical protein